MVLEQLKVCSQVLYIPQLCRQAQCKIVGHTPRSELVRPGSDTIENVCHRWTSVLIPCSSSGSEQRPLAFACFAVLRGPNFLLQLPILGQVQKGKRNSINQFKAQCCQKGR